MKASFASGISAGVEDSPEAPEHGAAPGRKDSQHAKVYLLPGQLFASSEPSAVTTILGSCVAVCLWDRTQRIGGINHFLLPFSVGNGLASPRFGNVAVQSLIEKLLTLGSQRQRLEAKLFGGACVLGAFLERENHLGTKNVEAARKLLEAQKIAVVGEDVGGRQGRKLIFHTDEGTTLVKLL